MTPNKTKVAPTATRGEPLRRRVIDAAERLLRQGKAGFSMRDLATEAGVSFATPFNQFGSKAAIMHALSRRRIDTMAQRFAGMSPPADAAGRVLLAIDTAVEVMLEEPEINRAVMGWIGTAGPSPGKVLAHSTTLWSLALGAGEGLIAAGRQKALRSLPEQLAFAFRGVLSFWTAGELPDEALASKAREIAKTLLLGFAERPLFGDSAS
ncbi:MULTISPECIES: TetR/AcrR family transcriptional regulator [unclassified Mesorhizobium]|uniref:TetR/AcrR family transcriptional regulator n=1 Tax=unclassified Mesorhizobium TaxID=325217 RepID=UPI00112A3763|nr:MULTISPECIES: TetR/AcrR family transcriptional regulator [unclassified Mesorhizobium]MCA0058482.1 TetR/AcrR family transcriptional regulator [Mesorhizobium sp. B261B1A]TPI51076.1 TetR/AcrR family transcriptional regulator [Mesorhizobium sp. B3-1-1]TPJ60996.1 TetR/AcrR family transcriptional regulator [Mesorhizobium sp. B2-6-7]TPJ79810.1 TetR/AcrR family transcriptional regulator [Mesorhizobium sp. B2-6-3]TPJ96168.1 TetR/AcrR family transcriptional regulator [Mesorhizobium sp. B2-5-10]